MSAGQDGHARDARCAVHVGVGHLRIARDLVLAGVAAQLQHVLVDLAQSRGADRLAIGQAAAVGVDREPAVDLGVAVGLGQQGLGVVAGRQEVTRDAVDQDRCQRGTLGGQLGDFWRWTGSNWNWMPCAKNWQQQPKGRRPAAPTTNVRRTTNITPGRLYNDSIHAKTPTTQRFQGLIAIILNVTSGPFSRDILLLFRRPERSPKETD